MGFALIRFVIGAENLRHPLDQSEARLKSITTWSPAFSRAFDSLFGCFALALKGIFLFSGWSL